MGKETRGCQVVSQIFRLLISQGCSLTVGLRSEQEATRHARREAAVRAATLAAAAAAQRTQEQGGNSEPQAEDVTETGPENSSDESEQIHELPTENSPRETSAPQESEESSN